MKKRLNKKNMVIVNAWVEMVDKDSAIKLASLDDVTLSRWIRRAIKEKLIRDTPSTDKK